MRGICRNEIDYSICYSRINLKDHTYNEGKFWSEKSIKVMHLKFDRNLNFCDHIFFSVIMNFLLVKMMISKDT